MAVTLAGFAAVQLAWMKLVLRPHLISPLRDTTTLTASAIQGLDMNGSGNQLSVFAAAPNLPGAWIYSNQVVTPSGSTSMGSIPQPCQPQAGQGFPDCANALAQLHLKQVVVYQPADRYWTFQWLELAIFLTVAVLLAWGCFWWGFRAACPEHPFRELPDPRRRLSPDLVPVFLQRFYTGRVVTDRRSRGWLTTPGRSGCRRSPPSSGS